MIIAFQILLFLILYYLFFQINFTRFFLDQDFGKPQSFHSTAIPRIGGTIIFLNFFLFFFFNKNQIYDYNYIILFLTANFFLGLIDDVKLIKNPLHKFLLFFLINIFLIIFFSLKVNFFNNEILDTLNEYKVISFFITFFCLFFVINGSNLIDGFNGLLAIHAIIITLILIFVTYSFGITVYSEILLIFLISIFSFLFFNIPKAKIFLGDSGSYFIGCFLSLSIIFIFNKIENVSPFFFAIIIFYIFFEIFFSVFRKLYEKKNPFFPDRNHLHMLVYKFLKKRKVKGNKNFLTSLLINSVYLFLVAPSFFFLDNNFFCEIYFFLLILTYFIIYIKLKKKLNRYE
jgi:UDP-GlcNAc:undecaprenyl-phosphate GlcNAc-1-phosphate transferase